MTQVATYPETVLDAALWVADTFGAYVFEVDHPDLPVCIGVRTKEHDPATCTKRGKHPAVPEFSIDATNKARDIIARFTGTTRNYGVVTRESGLLVIDEDDAAAYRAKLAELGQCHVDTFRVNSHGDRWHHWYRIDRDTEVGNGQLCRGVDIRAGAAGYVVGPGSKHATGVIYSATWDRELVPAPDWLIEALLTKQAKLTDEERAAGHDQVPDEARELMAEPTDKIDRSTHFYRIVGACKRAGVSPAATIAAVTPWCRKSGKYVGRVIDEVERAWPKLDGPGTSRHAEGREDLWAGTDATVEQPTNPEPEHLDAVQYGADLDVTNPAESAGWLRANIGRRQLAGLFDRAGSIAFIAREGEAGYVPPKRDGDHDGPAQVRPITAAGLAAYIDARYRCYRWVKAGEDFEAKPALFPAEAARRVVDLPDPSLRPGLRQLAGVTHTPTVRPDGSILDAPGYDQATRLYYLPDPGLTVPAVPDRPTDEQVKAAVALLDEMIAGFPWKSEHNRANYLGVLLTPLLRSLTPPPYKLIIFDAPQQGTGKTMLADLARILHGGVLRGGVQHGDDAEMRKTITTVLARTTGPVVIFDNLTGMLDSPVIAGLLTSAEWTDRILGATEEVHAVNDRLWTATANNLAVGVDMVRRTIWTGIDAQMSRPQDRTAFAISDLPGWVRTHRGELLHALLVLVRAWVVAGRPVGAAQTSDGFAAWIRTVDGILANAGMSGRFADKSTEKQEVGDQDDEWGVFLAAAFAAFGDRTWTAQELLVRVPTEPAGPHSGQALLLNGAVIPVEALPEKLVEKALRHPKGAVGVARSLGMWLNNRDGRFVGSLVARSIGIDRDGKKMWRVVQLSAGSPAGTAGTAGTISAPHAGTTYGPATEGDETVDGGGPTGPASPRSPRSPREEAAGTWLISGEPVNSVCKECSWPFDSAGHATNCRVAA